MAARGLPRCLLALLALLSDQSILCAALRSTGEILDVLNAMPGPRQKQPTHVTRLHRYDHSGLDAMLEAEARWHGGGQGAPEAAVSGFVQLSSKQMLWLRDHHSKVLVQMGTQTGGNTGNIGVEVQAHEASSMTHARQGHATGPTVTRMSNLASQYVGPLSVGTVTSPLGCKAMDGAALAYLERGSATSLADSSVESCHMEEQSQIWAVFDTGSTNLWIASDLCKKGPCTKKGRHRYNHSLSQTYAHAADKLHVTFGTGSLSGPMAVDDFHVGPFTVYDQSFAMIEKQEGSVFEEVPFEGILGLAFPSMSANGVRPFFDSVVEQKALTSNAFAFYFSLNNPSANAIFWGGWDEQFHEGDVEYFKVVEEHYWSLALRSFQVGGQELLGDGGAAAAPQEPRPYSMATLEEQRGMAALLELEARPARAIVDTGTTLFTAQGKTYTKILSMLPSVPCKEMTDKSHPPMLFRLENEAGEPKDFELKNVQYMTADSTGGHCSVGFMNIELPKEHGPGMILGEIFLRHFFAVFDRGSGAKGEARVGFARAAHGTGVDEHLKDLTKTQPAFDAATRL